MITLNLTEEQVNIIWTCINKAPIPREITDGVASALVLQVQAQEKKETNV